MKKWIASLTAVLCLLSFAACGQEKPTPEENTPPAQTEEPAAPAEKEEAALPEENTKEENPAPEQEEDFDLEAALAEIDLADYPDSTPEAFEKFKEYLMQAGPEEAKLIFEDEAMIQMMLMDNYWQ